MLDKVHIPKFFKSFFFITAFSVFVWWLFFDRNDLITQIRMINKIENLKNEKEFYQEKINEIERAGENFQNDSTLQEKFAREKYLMKKDGEDVYIIVEEDRED